MSNVVCLCSFCNKDKEQLIAASLSPRGNPQAYICGECIELAMFALQEHYGYRFKEFKVQYSENSQFL